MSDFLERDASADPRRWPHLPLRRLLPSRAAAQRALPRPAGHGGLIPFGLLAAVIVAATVLAVRYVHDQRLAHHSAQLEAVSDLRAGQVDRWLKDRLALAQYARTSESLAALHRRWRDAGDIAARDQLLQRGAELNHAGRGVVLVDEHGAIGADEMGSVRATPPDLRAAALRAMTSGAVQHTGLYGSAGDSGTRWLDLLVPIVEPGLASRGAMALRLEPNDLLPTLQVWPVPSRSAVSMLVRREGDQLVGAIGGNTRPISTPDLLAARVIRGERPFAQATFGLDFRGTAVLGVVRPVAGTDWFVVSKIDRAEIDAEVWRDAVWIAATAALALLGAAIATVLLRERRALAAAHTAQARAVQRNEELRRLGAELEASEDRERRKIAHDLHDDLAQTLAAARIRLTSLCSHETEAVRSAARAVDSLVAAADLSTRSLAAQLAPAVLYELGLNPALDWLGEEIQKTHGLKVTLLDDGQPKPLSQETRSILYRAARELLINAAKHAACDAAVVETVRDGARITLSVSDDGVGFDPQLLAATPRHGMGLVSARDRLYLIGGTLELRSAPGDGTTGVLSALLATPPSMPAPAHA